MKASVLGRRGFNLSIPPDSIRNDIRRESVPFIGIHPPILVEFSGLTCQH